MVLKFDTFVDGDNKVQKERLLLSSEKMHSKKLELGIFLMEYLL